MICPWIIRFIRSFVCKNEIKNKMIKQTLRKKKVSRFKRKTFLIVCLINRF